MGELLESEAVQSWSSERPLTHHSRIRDGELAVDATPGRILIPLTQGQHTLIDECDVQRVSRYKWQAEWSAHTRSFYASTSVTKSPGRQTKVSLHRLITGAAPGQEVDHANHDTLDNRRSNLRIATRSENVRNRRGVPSNNTSGYVGVFWVKRDLRWRAQVTIHGRKSHVGYFADARSAAIARDEFLRNNFPSEFWTFNFPKPGERGIARALTEQLAVL